MARNTELKKINLIIFSNTTTKLIIKAWLVMLLLICADSMLTGHA